jgi:copper homeostasis protein
MKIELCAASVTAIKLAKELKFDRIELCENLVQGGITPSAGRIEYAVNSGVETHVLIRPRPGGFYYSQEEVDIMVSDIRFAKQLGAKGVVVGVLNAYRAIDEETLKKFMDAAENMEITFHRAFDDCVLDWQKRLDILMNAGVTRLLSSGLASNISNGISVLKEMKEYIGNNIQLMPGGGVSAGNVAKIITEVHPDAIHFSGTVKTIVDEESFFSETFLAIDENRVKRILEEIHSTLKKN